jgi:adenylate kinase
MLSEKTGLPHLSSGEVLRDEIRERTPFGLQIEEYVLRGEIGPQELITEVVFGYIERKGYGEGHILDGFPRTLYQAEKLDEAYLPDRCILIDVPGDMIIDRISGRLNCRNCGAIYNAATHPPASAGLCDICCGTLMSRGDDNAEALRRRLETYRAEVQPVLDIYGEAGRLITIDGNEAPEDVFESLLQAVTGR